MAYIPSTDKVGLWRTIGGNVVKEQMPGLDFTVAALGRSGLITLTVAAAAPVANQSTTAWFQPANPSYSAEGSLFLWNAATAAYAPATPALLWAFLNATAGATGTSWYTTAGGPPANTVGHDGDFAIRTDFPGGIYQKAAGAWPALPIPGTTYAVDSTALDASFGATPGEMLYRGALLWQSLSIGSANRILTSDGTQPFWGVLSAVLDAISNVRGSVLYRGAAAWAALAPAATAGWLLASQGTGADPVYVVPGAEFPTGTIMIFRQTAAPPNWTKQTSNNDCGLRVTSGTASNGGSAAFSTVFGQTAVGNTTITQTTMPSHNHTASAVFGGNATSGSAGGGTDTVTQHTGLSIGSTGSDGPHSHSINMVLAYVDVIIATKN